MEKKMNAIFQKMRGFDGDYNKKKYEELLDDLIWLNTGLFLVLPGTKDRDKRQFLRHQVKILGRIFDLKVARFRTRKIKEIDEQMKEIRIPDKPCKELIDE